MVGSVPWFFWRYLLSGWQIEYFDGGFRYSLVRKHLWVRWIWRTASVIVLVLYRFLSQLKTESNSSFAKNSLSTVQRRFCWSFFYSYSIECLVSKSTSCREKRNFLYQTHCCIHCLNAMLCKILKGEGSTAQDVLDKRDIQRYLEATAVSYWDYWFLLCTGGGGG